MTQVTPHSVVESFFRSFSGTLLLVPYFITSLQSTPVAFCFLHLSFQWPYHGLQPSGAVFVPLSPSEQEHRLELPCATLAAGPMHKNIAQRRAAIFHGQFIDRMSSHVLAAILMAHHRLVGSLVVTVPAAGWLWQQGPSKSDHGHGHAEHKEEAEETSGEESVEEEQPKDEPEESKEEGKEEEDKDDNADKKSGGTVDEDAYVAAKPVTVLRKCRLIILPVTPRDLQMERNELPQRKLARNK